MWYSVNESNYRHECKTSHLSIDRQADLEMMANQCAENFFNEHDGWECSWPIDITLYETEDDPVVAKLSVEMEAQPVFIRDL